MKYDLEERTFIFSENILELCKKAPRNTISNPIISQLIRSATSIGANYMEANGASSRKDFKHKISICKKEARETKYWIRLFVKVCPELKEECMLLWKESQELTLIFSKIVINTN